MSSLPSTQVQGKEGANIMACSSIMLALRRWSASTCVSVLFCVYAFVLCGDGPAYM